MAEPMRILLLSQFYPPVIGGAEVHVRALAEGLAACGHEVAVATQSSPELPERESRNGVDIYRLQGGLQRIGPLFTADRRHAPPFPDPEMTLRLARLVASLRPEIVHAHNWLGRSFIPLKKGSGARYLVTLHDCSSACTQFRMMYRDVEPCAARSFGRCMSCCVHHYGAVKGSVTLVSNLAMRRAEASAVDLFLPVSRAVADANLLAEIGARFEVVPNFSAGAEARGGDVEGLDELPGVPFILQVGDVVADKGVHVLLEAYEGLRNAPPLVLAGHVRTRLPDPLPAGVVVLGPRPHAFVLEAWRRSLFGTIPSLCLDASPTVTLEAMAASRAVVASALGGLIDQVEDGETGFLVPAGDTAALRVAMQRLVDEPGLATRFGERGRERFERLFSADVVIGRIEGSYARLLGRCGDATELRSAEGM